MFNFSNYEFLKLNLSVLSANLEKKSEIFINQDLPLKLNPNSFNKSNSSLMCQIIHFLLLSLNEEYKSTLDLCYPVITLKDLKLFKDTIYPLLQEILPKHIICGKSILDSANGEKLISFLRKFSDFVISSKLKNKASFDYIPDLYCTGIKNDDIRILQMKKNILITHISNSREILLEKVKNINLIQENWKKLANTLTNEIQDNEKKNKTLKNKVNSILKYGSTKFNDISSIDRAPKIENQKEFIKMVDSLNQKFIKNEEFKNNINFISENNELYDIISPETFSNDHSQISKKNENNNEIILLHEESKVFDKRIKEDNNKKINENDDNESRINEILKNNINKIEEITSKLNQIKEYFNKMNN